MIDLLRHATLASRLLGSTVVLSIVHKGAVIQTAGGDIDESRLTDAVLAHSNNGWQISEPLCFQDSGSQFCILELKNHLSEGVAQLAFCVHQGVDSAQWLVSRLQPVADGVAAELLLNAELDQMAEELAARYEELNLVFETQDDVQDVDDSQLLLQKLVENCHTYMEVGVCALFLPNQQRTLSSISLRAQERDAQDALDELQSSLVPSVLQSQKTLVANSFEDANVRDVCADLGQKTMAVPLVGRRDTPMGVLIVAKPLSDSDFTNSDRNLLEVMARKAAKILLASYDELTGLLRRPGFEQEVAEVLAEARENESEHALILLNIDRMQVVNDNFGVAGGDAAIRSVAEILRSNVRADDVYARLEGDVFAVLLHNCPSRQAAAAAGKLLAAVLECRVHLGDQSFDVSASFGGVLVDADSESVASLFGEAEVALSMAKDQGGQQVCMFQSGDNEAARRQGHMQMVGLLQDALHLDHFELFAQPIVPLTGDGALHAEILLRLRGEDGDYLSPALFLPAAERYHLMPAIDRWVIRNTLATLHEAIVFDAHPGMVFTINLTGQSLSDPGFSHFVEKELNRYSFPDYSLCFEITETTAIGDLVRAQEFIASMRKRRVLFALDDFGTGLSSFAYLKQLDLDYLKIDGAFVKDICTDPVAETMVRAINDVAQSMQLKSVGEFVVNLATRDKLVELGVDYGQGFALAEPQPLREVLGEVGVLTHLAENPLPGEVVSERGPNPGNSSKQVGH